MFGANYGGTQPATSANVKSFVTGSLPDVWKYVTINGEKMLTMSSSTSSMFLQNNLTVDGDLTVNGVIHSTVCVPSDEKLKHSITELTLGDKMSVMRLTPMKFAYNSDITKTTHFGFIAQQVEPLLPNLVVNGAHKSVNYTEMIPLLLANMQDMQKQINQLQTELNELKSPH